MGVLEGLKRRLLGGSNRGARPDAAELARRAGSAAPEACAATLRAEANLPPAQWHASQHASTCSHPSPLATALELPSPRRVPLGGLPSQLAALQQRFAELPHTHQSPSRAALAARLAAARHGASTTQNAGKTPAKAAAGSSPRKGALRGGKLAVRRPTLRSSASLRRHGSAASAAAEQAGIALSAASQSPAVSPVAGSALKRSKLAHLKQRQALRSADGSRPATGAASPGHSSLPGPAAPESSYASSVGRMEAGASVDSWTGALSRTQSEEAGAWTKAAAPPQQGQHKTTWSGAAGAGYEGEKQPTPGEQHRLPMLTPRVLAAAAQQAQVPDLTAQPQSRPGTHAAGGRLDPLTATAPTVQRIGTSTSGSQHSMRNRLSSHSELGLTLAPWAADGSQFSSHAQGTALNGSAVQLPLPSSVQRAEAAAVPLGLAALQEAAPAGQSAGAARAEAEVHSSAVQRQRLSARHELPLDLLSLRDSASLARSRSLAPGLPLLARRRACSAQEASSEAVAAGHSAAGCQPAAAAAAASKQAAGEGRAARQLPALGRQRRPGWNSDFAGVVPGWQPPGQVRKAF